MRHSVEWLRNSPTWGNTPSNLFFPNHSTKEVITTELKQVKKGNGDSKKHRVLIEFAQGTREYEILAHAQANGYSISATLTPDVSELVQVFGEKMGMKAAVPVVPAPKPSKKQ